MVPANLNTLPPELKALIAQKIQEVDNSKKPVNEVDSNRNAGTDTVEQSSAETTRGEIMYHPTTVRREVFIDPQGWSASERGGQGESKSNEETSAAVQLFRERSRIARMTALGCMSTVSKEWSYFAFPLLWNTVTFGGQDNTAVRWFIEHIIPRHSRHITSIWFRISYEGNGVPRPQLISNQSEDLWDESERDHLAVELRKALSNLVALDTDFSAPVFTDNTHSTNAGFLRHDIDFPGRITSLVLSASIEDFNTGLVVGAFALGLFETTLRELKLRSILGRPWNLLRFIANMSRLERLEMVACDFLGWIASSDIAKLINTTSLHTLQLMNNPALSLDHFIQLIEALPNLTSLRLDNSHISSDDGENTKLLDNGKSFALPSLRHLVITNLNHEGNFLRAFDTCSLKNVVIAYNSELSHGDYSALIEAHRTTLKAITLPYGCELEAASHWIVCKPLGIEVAFISEEEAEGEVDEEDSEDEMEEGEAEASEDV